MKIKQALAAFMPGIFLLGFNIGTGSVTSMAKAGAEYGMGFLWTIVLSCIITYFMIVIYGRFTMVTGETALFAFRKHLHPALGMFFLVAMALGVSGGIMGAMGIVADISQVFLKAAFNWDVSPVWIALFYIILVYLIFLQGSTRFFQNVLAVIVAIMGFSFLLNFFLLTPPVAAILKGMIPHIPASLEGDVLKPYMVMTAMAGTTVASGIFIIRTTQIKEAGWTVKDFKVQNRDACVSAILMFVMSATIMAAAAETLYNDGIGLEKASDMINLLEPIAGKFAMMLFVFGIVAAGVSSQVPNVLFLPWLICDYFNLPRDMTQWRYRLIVAGSSLLGLVVPLVGARPVVVMIVSQALNVLILPATVVCIIILGRSKKIMGQYTHKAYETMLLGLVLVFACFMTFQSVLGLIKDIQGFIEKL